MTSQSQAVTRGKRPAGPPKLLRPDDGVETTEVPEKRATGALGVILLPSENGDVIKRYNEAKKLMQDNKAIVDALEAEIKAAGMSGIFKHNCADTTLEPISSVKVQDVYEDPATGTEVKGELCRVTFQNRYNNCDAVVVEAAFSAFKDRNINDYVAVIIESTGFDSRIWLNPDGSFNKEKYNRVVEAIKDLAEEMGYTNEKGDPDTPLRTMRKMRPKEDFHQRRFTDFSVKENTVIFDVLPNTVSATPLRT